VTWEIILRDSLGDILRGLAQRALERVSAFAPISVDKPLRCKRPKSNLKPIGDASFTGRSCSRLYRASRVLFS
jgi:hypothetical protein